MKTFIGKVIANKMNKTLVVEKDVAYHHKLYHKIIKRARHVKIHNDISGIMVGDMVAYVSCKPISKEKHFKTVEKIN